MPSRLWLVAGCATPPPSGPWVMVLPGSTKTFDQFRYDDYECRQYAELAGRRHTPQQASNDSGVKSAVVGTAVGAAAGGLMGGNAGAGVGAGVGARRRRARRHRRRESSGLHAAAALRRGLPAVHVRQGPPDPDGGEPLCAAPQPEPPGRAAAAAPAARRSASSAARHQARLVRLSRSPAARRARGRPRASSGRRPWRAARRSARRASPDRALPGGACWRWSAAARTRR